MSVWKPSLQLGLPASLNLQWSRCQGNVWCGLNTVDLTHPALSVTGVYIIWHGGTPAQTVRVGQGSVRDRFAEHRTDPAIQAFASLGLFVTWATVAAPFLDGVERFLAEALHPIVGHRFPVSQAISVNLPW